MTRSKYNWIVGVFASVLGPVSLYVALKQSIAFDFCSRGCVGKSLLAVWLLIPPVFFWMDWVVFSRNLTAPEREVAQHSHDLSRNIWLALVASLVVIFGLTFSG
jgi:hypothetical protein